MFTPDLHVASLQMLRPGFLLRRGEEQHLVLVNTHEHVIDVRGWRGDEVFADGALVSFPCHIARVDAVRGDAVHVSTVHIEVREVVNGERHHDFTPSFPLQVGKYSDLLSLPP